jgi:multidrug efflux pump subunit AcrA (membrane-fusion protein)
MTGEAQAREGPASTQEEIVVPLTATFSDLPTDAHKNYVWIFDPGKKTVSRREVKLGPINVQGIKVGGVRSGEWVVTAGVHHLHEGERVEVLKSGDQP